jgi:hypothetical protein
LCQFELKRAKSFRVFFEPAPDTPLPPEHPTYQQVRRCQTQPNSPTQIVDNEKRVGTRKCCPKRDREHHPKEKSASGQMRFEGSPRIEIFFFDKCIRQDHGTLGTEKDTKTKATLVYTPRISVLIKRSLLCTEPLRGGGRTCILGSFLAGEDSKEVF